MKCPHCGGNLYLSGTPPRGVRLPKKANQSYSFDVEAIAPAIEAPHILQQQAAHLEPGEVRERNQYQNQTLADVQVKLIRTAVYAVAVPLASIVPTMLIDWLPWYAPLVTLPVTALAAWTIIDRGGFDPLVAAEKLTRIDINGDGQIGNEPPAPTRHLVTVAVDEGQSRRYLNDIPVTPQLKRYLAAFLESRTSFAEKAAAVYDVGVVDFEKLRDEMIDRGMLRWKNPDNHRSGYYWSPVARRALAELRSVPLLDDD